MGWSEDPSLDDTATFDLETVEITAHVGEAKAILENAQDAIDERYQSDSGVFPRVLILGRYEYTVLDAWLRYDSGHSQSADTMFACDVYTVPGRMIHVPKKNEFVPTTYLTDADE